MEISNQKKLVRIIMSTKKEHLVDSEIFNRALKQSENTNFVDVGQGRKLNKAFITEICYDPKESSYIQTQKQLEKPYTVLNKEKTREAMAAARAELINSGALPKSYAA